MIWTEVFLQVKFVVTEGQLDGDGVEKLENFYTKQQKLIEKWR
jgi:hypothetical protein